MVIVLQPERYSVNALFAFQNGKIKRSVFRRTTDAFLLRF
ncbi:hypothetical protein STL3553_c47760 [Salmonella enterica subsp. enterica serovar Typhimurium str. L-3553]|uniref:Uncharacterized protein n=2 Tax=Salmonella enterica I TaxID=59201 RepID=A0A0F6BAV5_SALT1|nr:hypothetical protein STM14_5323 [Salmonella enterica subsp. enterica serovar Typhimurium str. 14028S]AVU73024.1 hypothetical protein FORC58_4080 [Salmonella enterica subsp. enterica serovar Typhimurium]EDY26478.1 hypothetical protein SeSPA_A0318 [Salmonella enterica subsp. enterica serovar Saintpaul str. SARA23]EDZ17088.1 hypothetical protein SeI_A0278 [Salmonella enterica subsp. enterica serovar 4 [Salmonella enterica subsp. enterica serovar 4 [Salmonella enterica subsp. enterica serovar 4,[